MNIPISLPESQKVRSMYVGAILLILIRVFDNQLNLTPDDVKELTLGLTGIFGSFLVGQGIADFGKGRAKVEIQAQERINTPPTV